MERSVPARGVVAALVKQLGTSVEIVSHQPGTEFIINARLEAG